MRREDEPDDPLCTRNLAALDEAITRAELQLELLRAVIAMRIVERRDHERLDRLSYETEQRLNHLRAEVTRLRAER
jgi:hypothetical protein